MIIDNQLMLGVIFITAGIALGLLAYAAFLNRQAAEEEGVEGDPDADTASHAEEPSENEPVEPAAPTVSAREDEPDQTDLPTPPSPVETEEKATAGEAPAAPSPAEEKQPELPEAPPPPPAATAPSSGGTARPAPPEAATVPSGAPPTAEEERAALEASVRIRRDPETERIVVDVEDRTYRSIDELRASPDWPKIDTLFSDILAWLIKEEATVRPDEEGFPADRPDRGYPPEPKSMIEQINEVLEEKLAEREGGPLAVRLAEGAGGSIRVYIGVESYLMDEVPDQEVRAIIRQAVKEWEARG